MKETIVNFVSDHPITTVVLAASVVGIPLLIWAIHHFRNN